MARHIVVAVFCALVGPNVFAQSGAVIPEGGAGHATQATCVILKRMGPADEVTSHLYSFGIRGKQFQYIEGKLPEGFPFHGRLTDHDVRNLQARGAEVLVLESHYTAEDLRQARADCRGETGKTPNQSEAKAAATEIKTVDKTVTSSPTTSPAATSTNTVAAVPGTTAKLTLDSDPSGADIEIDGDFVGNTPSEVQVTEGEHAVVVRKNGFNVWTRKMKASAGSNVHLNAQLEKSQPQ